MSFENFYVSNYPSVYPDRYVIQKLDELKLRWGMNFNIDNYYLHDLRDIDDYIDHVKRRMTNDIGDKMLKEGKISFKSFDNPAINSRTIQAEALVMSKKELYQLLQQFGVYIKVTK